jgi:hypothetical protein
LVLSRLGDAAKAALEALMLLGKYECQSEFARKYIALGKAKGKAEGEAKAVLAVLRTRGIPVPSEARERILACRDIAQLDRWIEHAVTVASIDVLLDAERAG